MSGQPLICPYVVVDVFTTAQFGGNQLAVITDARGLSGTQMQQIAAEFKFSETTFVLPPADASFAATVRIFTQKQEVPFAGHPNVGTAYVLGRQDEIFGKAPAAAMRFDEKAGPVDITLLEEDDEVRGATITAPQALETGAEIDAAVMADCVGLSADDVVLDNHGPTMASVGLPFVVVELTPDALSRAKPSIAAFEAAASEHGHADLVGRLSAFYYARNGEGIDRLRARMFAPLSGTYEDPATGSASAALGAFLASLDERFDGDIAIRIEQGVEMERPSVIELDIRKAGGSVGEVRITGRCVHVMRGQLEIG